MNERVLKTLEYNKIIEQLSECAGSNPGKSICEKLRPSTNPEWIEDSQNETEAAVKRLLKNDRVSFGSNTDIRGLMKYISVGKTASPGELLAISRLLGLTDELAKYGEKAYDEEPDDALTHYFNDLYPLPLLHKEISRCIISEEEIADDASPELSRIRKSYSIIGGRIHSQLNHMVQSTYRSYLQECVITQRNNRYCLPVKAEYKSSVPGMIHDQSSTGSTLFIEPQSIVSLNNELKELELNERDEIANILAGLSARVAAQSDIVLLNQKTITMLDFIFAKGKYALKNGGSRPLFNDDHRINLRQARHPLLDRNKAVPITVSLGDTFDLLIVTGPNTGGKTVSIKTVGLLTLMGQSGLHIPAGDRSELGFFKEVYADIGDEQSIEQSLSTFSSHMTGIVNILKKADADSLCLFDELGAGTDPTEGAALAISILDYLHERGIRTMATTHYSELKIYALSTSFVENACCEFDVNTLSPTYRLLVGIPGKSNAFAISEKLGLPAAIIDKARSTLTSEAESFENVISDLEAKRILLEKEKQEVDSYKQEIEKLKAELSEKNEKLSAQKEKILREAREEAKDLLKEAKDVADETIRAFQKQSTVMSIQTMEKKRSKIREKISEHDSKKQEAEKSTVAGAPLTIADAVPGTAVHIISMNMDGVISTRPDSRGNVTVTCGNISSKTSLTNLCKATTKPVENKAATGKIKKSVSKAMTMSSEINVIGLTVDEAVIQVDKFLDDAYLCHLGKVRIVHGKGTGALRNGIHSFLRSCPYVSRYELAAYGEGDGGVTVVEL